MDAQVAKQKPYNFYFYGPGTALITKIKSQKPDFVVC